MSTFERPSIYGGCRLLPTANVSSPVAQLEGQLSGGEIAHPAVAGRPIAARQASPKLSDAHRGILEFRFHEAAARDPRGHEYNMTTTGANDLRVYAMPHDRMLEAMRKHGPLP